MSLVAAMLESREKKSAVKKCEHTSLLSIELSRFCAFLETKKDEDIQNLQIKKEAVYMFYLVCRNGIF